MKILRLALQAIAGMAVLVGAFRFTVDEYEVLPKMTLKRSINSFRSAPTPTRQVASCLDDGLKKVVKSVSESTGIDSNLILAVIHVESSCKMNALSPRGAVGLMQVMPATAKGLGVSNLHLPEKNILAGAKYLESLNREFGKDLQLTLAAYNAGPAAVKRHKGVPPYTETQSYVRKVMKRYGELKAI